MPIAVAGLSILSGLLMVTAPIYGAKAEWQASKKEGRTPLRRSTISWMGAAVPLPFFHASPSFNFIGLTPSSSPVMAVVAACEPRAHCLDIL